MGQFICHKWLVFTLLNSDSIDITWYNSLQEPPTRPQITSIIHQFRLPRIINPMNYIPIGSMYGISGNIYHQYTPNVSINLPYMDPMGYEYYKLYSYWRKLLLPAPTTGQTARRLITSGKICFCGICWKICNARSHWRPFSQALMAALKLTWFLGDGVWLVVGLPLWKIWVRQLGWLTTQYMGKCQIDGNQSPPTSWWSASLQQLSNVNP